MMTWGLIRTMVQKGYTFEMGPHAKGMRGYWACFYKHDPDAPECDECGETHTVYYWKGIGHAMTPYPAVVMAAKIALGRPVVVPESDGFKL